MRIAMVVNGSRGDVQPMVALAQKLQEHGHEARLSVLASKNILRHSRLWIFLGVLAVLAILDFSFKKHSA